MKNHIRDIAKKRISDFIRLESGRIGGRNALTAAAIITISSLGAILLTPDNSLLNIVIPLLTVLTLPWLVVLIQDISYVVHGVLVLIFADVVAPSRYFYV